jgi:PAS domain S-box-containing protein
MKTIADLAFRDFVTFPAATDAAVIKEDILSHFDRFILVADAQKIVGVYRAYTLLHDILKMESENRFPGKAYAWSAAADGLTFSIMAGSISAKGLTQVATDIVIAVREDDNTVIGIVDNVKTMTAYLECLLPESKQALAALSEYRKIFECFEEEIFVTDQNGYILELNPTAERVCGVNASEIIGKHVDEVAVTGMSITMAALKEQKKVHMVQKIVRTGKTVLTTAIPIFDNGNIVRIVSTSKNISEINQLTEELEMHTDELERKRKELDILSKEIFYQVGFVSSSKDMDYIKDIIKKIAALDMTILINGESGVGKEVVTKSIHCLSDRKDQAFVKINCGLIPENLLESELFGYEGGAYTGANKNGKIGKIELAEGGTLFLDEIGELPLGLQVKLLELLQDKSFCRVGGTKRIKVDIRVIAATNRDLKEMVAQRLFRQDLYYRLNVIPLTLTPLRERRDDIPCLVNYFLDKFNTKYQIKISLEPEVVKVLINYGWPGNVRELEHVIERLLVTGYSNTVTAEQARSILEFNQQEPKIICTDLMPLKIARRQLEEQLVRSAYETYRSTYKAAKVLEIDQSTVVKILKKYKYVNTAPPMTSTL